MLSFYTIFLDIIYGNIIMFINYCILKIKIKLNIIVIIV